MQAIFPILLDSPADEKEQQCAQDLVAHLQAQVPIRQEETGMVREEGSLAHVPGPGTARR